MSVSLPPAFCARALTSLTRLVARCHLAVCTIYHPKLVHCGAPILPTCKCFWPVGQLLLLLWHYAWLKLLCSPTCTKHMGELPTHALSPGHAQARPGPASGGVARGPYLRAARPAAAVRARRPLRATCTKHIRAVPARPLGSGTCAAPPGGGCSGCAGGVPEFP